MIKPIDLIWSILILVFLVSSYVFAIIYVEDWDIGGFITLTLTCLVFCFIILIYLIKKSVSGPKWISAQGIKVWGKIPYFDKQGKAAFNRSIEEFVKYLVKHKSVPREHLMHKLSCVCLEWTTKPISIVGIGWEVKDKAGVQQDNKIMVKWNGSLSRSALAHELIHYVRQAHTGLPPDYKHQDLSWWNFVPEINKEIEAIESYNF